MLCAHGAAASASVTGVTSVNHNGARSNTLGFTVTSPGGGPVNGLTLMPSMVNMLVGDTRTLQALSSTGTTLTGLTWTSSDQSIVSFSTDDPPVLTALAAGRVTITATSTTNGSAAADVTVADPVVLPGGTLPLGTVLWSNPGDGSGVQSIVPAVPSSSGVAGPAVER